MNFSSLFYDQNLKIFISYVWLYIYWSSNIHTGCENRKIAASDQIIFSGYIGGRPICRRTAIYPSESSRIAIRRKNWLWKSFYSSIDFGRWKRPWDFSWSIFLVQRTLYDKVSFRNYKLYMDIQKYLSIRHCMLITIQKK